MKQFKCILKVKYHPFVTFHHSAFLNIKVHLLKLYFHDTLYFISEEIYYIYYMLMLCFNDDFNDLLFFCKVTLGDLKGANK